MLQGIVTKSTGSWYMVKTGKEEIPCRIRGKFKLEDRSATNPIAVGDKVILTIEKDSGTITEILPRKNYIIRESPKHRKATHIIAANIDSALLIASLSHPRTSLGFIDRFLVTATAYHIPACLIFNKADIYQEKDKIKLNNIFQFYEAIGYPCRLVSALQKENIDIVKKLIAGKIILLTGHSGTGKSTLLNVLNPQLELKTAEISRQTNKGMHATTFAEMFEMPFGGMVIDTPGIKEFGLVDMKPEEVSHFFPEMFGLLKQCRFDNCLHINEPQCAVKNSLETGKIAISRYESYLSMVDELKHKGKEQYL